MTMCIPRTPAEDGFRMPGEFERHAGTWMLWPERPDNWRLGAKPAQKAFVDVAAAISEFEPVTMGVNARQFANARSMLPARVRVVELSNNDSWMRDFGPTFVVGRNGDVRAVNWQFNAWGGLEGGLYFPWDLDDAVAIKVAEIEHAHRYDAPLVLEGGSIHVDGEGTLFTTEECLLNPNRNPRLSRDQIEAHLKDCLGVSRIIWIPRGLHNDETDGHVDNIVVPVRPGVVVLAWTDDSADPQYEISREAYEVLSRETDARGRRLEIVKLQIPGPLFITEEESQGIDAIEGTLPRPPGERMAASYVNYYTCNGGVIVPTFADPRDAQALDVLQRLYPDRRVVGVAAREILLGGGNIHCITQQQPAEKFVEAA